MTTKHTHIIVARLDDGNEHFHFTHPELAGDDHWFAFDKLRNNLKEQVEWIMQCNDVANQVTEMEVISNQGTNQTVRVHYEPSTFQ